MLQNLKKKKSDVFTFDIVRLLEFSCRNSLKVPSRTEWQPFMHRRVRLALPEDQMMVGKGKTTAFWLRQPDTAQVMSEQNPGRADGVMLDLWPDCELTVRPVRPESSERANEQVGLE